MPKYILGGGLVALLAKKVLGEDYVVIPHGPSRYYSFDPAIADDYILVSDKTDPSILGTNATRGHLRAFSLSGQLIFAPQEWLYNMYSNKIYGYQDKILRMITPMEAKRSIITAGQLYRTLLGFYMPMLTENMTKYGTVSKIEDGVIKTSTGLTLDYKEIISTIPLDVIYKLTVNDEHLESRDVWVYHVKTDQLDLEGADEVFVVDETFPFYKVNQVGEYDYLFYCLQSIDTPSTFFNAFTNNKCEVVNAAGTLNKAFIPLGGPKVTHKLENLNIRCVGSLAQWDDGADIGTCIIRLSSKSN